MNPSIAQPEDMWHVHYVQEHGLAVFKMDLLHGLTRFPRYPNDWSPTVDEYFTEPAWNSRAPANVPSAAQQQPGADQLDAGRSG